MNVKILLSSLFVVAILVGFATTGGAAGGYTEWGEPAAVGEGQARTFVTLDGSGKPEAVGMQLSAAALSGLPAEVTATTLQFPEAAKSTVFDHFLLDWNPHGHEPPGVYNLSHFDFHFYMISEEERASVQAGACTSAQNSNIPNPPGMAPVPCDVFAKAMQPLPADMAPPDYQLAPAVVPDMGNHLMDLTAPEFNGQPFTQTWIYGVYGGKITFFEPMITKAFLETRPDVSVKLKTPETMPEAGWYPTEYSIHYLADQKTYSISLEGFKWFEASGAQMS